MSQLRVPFSVISSNDGPKPIVVYSHVVEKGKYEVRAIPSWPCYAKDGAGTSMYFHLECVFIDSSGREYEVKEIKWED